MRAKIVTFSMLAPMESDGEVIQRSIFVITETQFAIQRQVT